MDMGMVSLGNGAVMLRTGKASASRADSTDKSDFAAQIEKLVESSSAKPVTDTVELSGAETAASAEAQAAWNKLSERTQEVLRRLKAGGMVGKGEWMDARKDMLWSGVIDALQYSGGDPDGYPIGVGDGHGNEYFFPPFTDYCTSADVGKNHPMGANYRNYWSVGSAGSWLGGDMCGSYVDQLLSALRNWKGRLDGMTMPNGQKYDTSGIEQYAQQAERFYDRMDELMACC